jgi:hypothetical protein
MAQLHLDPIADGLAANWMMHGNPPLDRAVSLVIQTAARTVPVAA